MKEQRYRIIFKGEILPNANLEEVKQKLAAFYKVDVKEIDSLFSGKNFVLKENVDLDAAQNYMYQLEQAGALCELVEMEAESKKPPAAATPEKTPGTTPAEKEIEIEKPLPGQTQYELRYQMLFKGETIHGKDINEVKTNLSMFYKVKPDKLAGLFTGKPITVTPEPTDFWTAATYLNRFNECGAVSYLDLVESPETVEEKPGKYKVVFWGDLQKGHDVLTVKTNIASMFKVSGVVADKLFRGKPVLVRTDLSRDAAQSFKMNFEKTGARCQVLTVAEKPPLSAPGVTDRETETAVTQPPAQPSSPSAAPRPITVLQPRQPAQTGKKINVFNVLLIAVAIFVVFVIFKAISGSGGSEPEPTPSEQTVSPPPASQRPPASRPLTPSSQPQPQTPSASSLQAEPTSTFEDPKKYYSVSLPEGYRYINESKEKQSKFLFNYSANINLTIIANPITEKKNHQDAMYEKVTEIENGNAGALSRLSISNYNLANFSGLEGFEIILERGTQMVHMYEMVSPKDIAFSIIIVTIGDNKLENHDILDNAVRGSLKY